MSLSAAHESKQIQKTCHSCGDRRARFRYRGVVKADRDHTLCFECFRAERNRRRALLLAKIPQPKALTVDLAVTRWPEGDRHSTDAMFVSG